MEITNYKPLDQDKIRLIKEVICPTITNTELQLFAYQCDRTQLDPLTRQIIPIKRWNKAAGKEVMNIMTSIDGFRLIAERTGKYQGQTKVEWCGKDGVWTDVWTQDENPHAARVGIHKEGFKEPLYAVAHFKEYFSDTFTWKKMAALMIAKCCEALGFRKAFPQELSGLYTTDEMDDLMRDNEPLKTVSVHDNLSTPIKNPLYRELVNLMGKYNIPAAQQDIWLTAADVKNLWEMDDEKLSACIKRLKETHENKENKGE